MKVNILGTKYTITVKSKNEDKFLEQCDGYCDKTTKQIVISAPTPDCTLGNWEEYSNKIKRHEIIHAYLFESGLHENFQHDEWGHDETFIDWFACQFSKILKTYMEVGCL